MFEHNGELDVTITGDLAADAEAIAWSGRSPNDELLARAVVHSTDGDPNIALRLRVNKDTPVTIDAPAGTHASWRLRKD